MRHISLLALACISIQASAIGITQKDTLINTRYQESEAEKASKEFKEAQLSLPAIPNTQNGDWFTLYVDEAYTKIPKILLSSIHIAPDSSVRYILNVQSSQAYNNLSVEGMFCATSSFNYADSKRSSYKIFGYADTVNNRWITPKKGEWKTIGSTMNHDDALHTVIYQSFCVDGIPKNEEGLRQRLLERAGRYPLQEKNQNNK